LAQLVKQLLALGVHGSPGSTAVLVGNEARQTSSCLNAFGHSNLSGG
jgi:hypothetical protein